MGRVVPGVWRVPALAWAALMQAWILASSSGVGGVICWSTWIWSPPVWISATIWGTVPSWCWASRVRPSETAATPGSLATAAAWSEGNVSWVAGRKKSCTKWSK